jgi:hypothetical protein
MYQFTIVILIETASLVLIHVNKNENCEKSSNFLMIMAHIHQRQLKLTVG